MVGTFLGINNASDVPAVDEITGHKAVREALRDTSRFR